jgi:predicted Zn-ribbon and HTH transcriptional regulator
MSDATVNDAAAGESQPVSSQAQKFPCSQCGAQLDYDPGQKMLTCPYCGHVQEIEAVAVAIEERDLLAALTDEHKAHGYGTEIKSVNCKSCGATFNVDPQITSTECPFCGSNQILEQSPDPDLIQPESLLPFEVDKSKAMSLFRSWLGSGWFRPGDLTRLAGAEQLTGMYIPYWTFDAQADSRWRAEAGHYYYEEELKWVTEDGERVQRRERVRKTRWEPASGSHSHFYDDLLTCGSKSINENIVRRLDTFETDKLVPYQPQYLSGWAAESYQVTLAEAWEIGKNIVEDRERDACDSLVPGDTHRNLAVNTTLSDITFKHVLLPIWIASYRYQGKVFQFMVNGQTGEVEGEAPISWIKVAIAVIVAVLILACVCMALNLLSGDSGSASLIFQTPGIC